MINPGTLTQFSDDSHGLPVEELLLFSTDGHRAVEVTHTGFHLGSGVPAMYDGNVVTQPVPVMVEGSYSVFDRTTGQYKEVTITAQDIQEYLHNTPRDVAMNYEHKRGGDPVGWLRLKDTAVCKSIKTRQGERLALFACMELYPEAASKVKRGVYRDGSIELRPQAKEIIGHALTGFPIMRDTQFYADPISDPETPDPTTVSQESNPAADPPLPAAPESDPTPAAEPESTTEEFSHMEPNEILSKALAEYGLTPDDLRSLPGLIASTEAEKRRARLTTAQGDVARFSADGNGNTFLTGRALEAAAQLYAFGQDHAELEFGEGEDKTNPAGLVERLLKGLGALQVFGETPGPSADQIEGAVPEVQGSEAKVDEDRVASLRSRIKANLKRAE